MTPSQKIVEEELAKKFLEMKQDLTACRRILAQIKAALKKAASRTSS